MIFGDGFGPHPGGCRCGGAFCAALNDYSMVLDLADAAAALVDELNEDVKTFGVDYLPESTKDAKNAVARALTTRAANSHAVT